MEFRLTYEGPLLADSNRDEKVRAQRRRQKQEIRKHLHPQLRHWWSISPYLSLPQDQLNEEQGGRVTFGRAYKKHGIQALAERFSRNSYNFVPLVLRELQLFCWVNVLLLRQGSIGGVLQVGGDIDNRFKVLFDALSVPTDKQHLGGYDTPTDDEKPFFVLLEDDSVITKATIETDVLLRQVSTPPDPNDVRAIITVTIKPARMVIDNVGFA
jgi:hypothetical protein